LLACNNSGNGNIYCCGVGANTETCCNDGYSFVVPVGQVIGHPTASTQSSILSSTTGTANRDSYQVVVNTYIFSISIFSPSVRDDPTQPSSNSKSSAITLGLGIGLGIPLSVTFFVLLFSLLKELRRQNNLREANRGKAHTKRRALPRRRRRNCAARDVAHHVQVPGRPAEDGRTVRTRPQG
jgi:hypothetical protein